MNNVKPKEDLWLDMPQNDKSATHQGN
uniref:Uncharacterized protein n=1 Tax=Anguilla anguilla TaxID=7936 RepID=A0A0E9Q852_ANGAN